MAASQFLCCLILLNVLIDVQAKALHQKSKFVTFQGFKQPSEIRMIPYLYTTSDPGISNIVENDYDTSMRDIKVSSDIYNVKIEPLRSTIPRNLEDELESKFDLSNHESLEQIFSLDPSDLSNFGELKKESDAFSQDIISKTIKPALHKTNVDYFTVDQVFMENKGKSSPRGSNTKGTKPLKISTINLNSDHSSKSKEATCSSQNLTIPKTLSTVPNIQLSSSVTPKLRSKRETKRNSNDELHVGNGMPIQILTEKVNDSEDLEYLSSKKANDSEDLVEYLYSNEHQNGEKKQANFSNVNPQSKSNNSSETGANDKIISSLNQSEFIGKLPVSLSQLQDEKSNIVDVGTVGNDLNNEVKNLLNNSFKSFVFNPEAQPQEKFQECVTRKNESGNCRYIQHCMLPSLLSSVQQFMDNVCIIREMFIGVCCPDFPVSTLEVNWPNKSSNSSIENNSVKTPTDCGVGTNTRIVGGSNANRKAWPWMVALLNNKKKFFCGGSLINNRYVLTASHCTFGSSRNQIIARLGEHDLKEISKPTEDYLVTEIKRHGQYTRVTLRNDIALLKLERPVKMNEFVKTICLPKTNEQYVGKTAFLAGWGHLNGGTRPANILQEVSFPIINNTDCEQTHGLPIPPSVVCAEALKKDKGACNGDSGGPLMLLDDDERWKVIGLVSWGRRGCNTRFPTVYTRVTYYLDWIKNHAI